MRRSFGRADVAKLGHLGAHVAALEAAVKDWVTRYNEQPPWDDITFRGGHTTTVVVIELEEV